MVNKILITGGLGYIGSHTALNFVLNTQDDIVIVDNLFNSSLSQHFLLNKLTNKNITFYKADISDYKKMIDIMSSEKINCVIHFASLKSVKESYEKPNQYYKNNILGLLNLLHAINYCQIKNFIFSSSATVYSQINQFPVSEDGLLGYSNPYGQTKLLSEDILIREHKQTGLNVAILRYFNPLGNHHSGYLGDFLKSKSNNIMPMIYKAMKNQSPFCIYGDDYPTYDGTPIRDYIHVEDLAEAHRVTLYYLLKNNGIVTFNVGCGKGVSVLELINNFCKVNNVKLKIMFKNRRLGDLPVCYANTNKIKKVLKWRPKKSLNRMCEDAFNFYSKHY